MRVACMLVLVAAVTRTALTAAEEGACSATDAAAGCDYMGAQHNGTAGADGDTVLCAPPAPVPARAYIPDYDIIGPGLGAVYGRQVPLRDLTLQVLVLPPAGSDDPGATSDDGYRRFNRSLQVQGVAATHLPPGTRFGDVALLRALEALATGAASMTSAVLILANPGDVILAGEATEITRKYQMANHSILFGAQHRCQELCAADWPRAAMKYGHRYLTPQSVIGTPGALLRLVEQIPEPEEASRFIKRQTAFLHHFYLDEAQRAEHDIALDANDTLFQTLYGLQDRLGDTDIQLEMTMHGLTDTRIQNVWFNTIPAVIRGGGNTKLLNEIGNYVPLSWTEEDGCVACREATLCFEGRPDAAMPSLFVAVQVPEASPFLELALEGVSMQDYPRSRARVLVDVVQGPRAARHLEIVEEWRAAHGAGYAEVTVHLSESSLESRVSVVTAAARAATDYALVLQSTAVLNTTRAVRHLMMQNKAVVSPMMTRDGSYFANFWGAMLGDQAAQCYDEHEDCAAWQRMGECTANNSDWMEFNCPLSCGQCSPPGPPARVAYARSQDYLALANFSRRGVWNVPFVFGATLLRAPAVAFLNASFLEHVVAAAARDEGALANSTDFELDVVAAQRLSRGGFHLHVDNQLAYGNLVNPYGYNASKTFPDVFLFEHNDLLWRRLYQHPAYDAARELEPVQGRCWDIFNFPVVSQRFCSEFISVSEQCGTWSSGDENDKRLKGGYEPVPTRDIHFNQPGMDFERTWLTMLFRLIAPIAEREFVGYHVSGKFTLDFVVKYTPEGQPFLRKHHDASAFSVNIALNQIGVDFEGGGTRFTRQNCTILTNQPGHAIIHPGRMTHQHEGLYVTNGTRYIMVSFVDQK